MIMGQEFSGKIAVITGGGTGVGRATAKFLAQKGTSVAIVGRREDKLREACEEISSLNVPGVEVKYYACDITDQEQVKSTFAKIAKDFGRVDFLVNNAGVNTYTSLEQIGDEQIEAEIGVKAKGIIYCTREAVKFMNEGGAVVNLTSVNAFLGGPSSPAYPAGNAVANNLTKSFAQKLAGQKIRVNAVAPGFVYPTGFTQNYDPEKLKKLSEANPLKRVATPDDVAKAIYFLLSDLSSYITGHTLHVNGGYYMN